jgi:hypothetical protein
MHSSQTAGRTSTLLEANQAMQRSMYIAGGRK